MTQLRMVMLLYFCFSPAVKLEILEEINSEITNGTFKSSNKTKTETVEVNKQNVVKKYVNDYDTMTSNWVDPFDMFDVSETLEVKSSKTNIAFDSCNKLKSEQIVDVYSTYASRWLNKLISKVEKEYGIETSSLTFFLDPKLIEDLKQVSSTKSLEMSELDHLICGMIDKSTVSKESYIFGRTASDWYTLYFNPIVAVIISLILSFTFYKCIKKYFFCTLLSCSFLINVVWHWMNMYQQKLAIKHAEMSMEIPNDCEKSNFGIFEAVKYYLKSWVMNDQCKKYYEALLVDPFWEVSPFAAISESLTVMTFQPFNFISKIINLSIRQLYDDLPLHITIILTFFIFMVLLMYFKYIIKFPLFMGAFEPHFVRIGSSIQDVPVQETEILLHETRLNAANSTETNLQNKSLIQILPPSVRESKSAYERVERFCSNSICSEDISDDTYYSGNDNQVENIDEDYNHDNPINVQPKISHSSECFLAEKDS